MFESIRFLARRAILRVADLVVTVPWLRWTWTGLADDSFAAALAELRPSDPEAVRELVPDHVRRGPPVEQPRKYA